MIGLEKLFIHTTKISDAGLAKLKRLTNLQSLCLSRTAISDAGLDHLTGLPRLRKLYLFQTKTTAPGRDRLQMALPKLVIDTETVKGDNN
jgi:hypothetical protein